MSGPIQNGFQGQVNVYQAPGQGGDFASMNPRAIALAGPGKYVSPASGLFVGRFCWANSDTGEVSQSYQPGFQLAFVHRENNAVITTFLGFFTHFVNAGFPLTLYTQGDFWGVFSTTGQPGDNVYANRGTGELLAGSTAPNTDAFTASAGFTGTAAVGSSFTIAVTSNVATISAVAANTYVTAGDIVTSASITGVALGAQLTGTPGGAGTYTLVHANVTAEAATTTSTVLNVTAVVRGALAIGSVVTGGGLAGGTTVTAVIAGSGGVGRYTVSGAAQSSASGTKNANTAVLDVTAVSSGTIQIGDVISGTGVTSGTQIVTQLSGTEGGVGTYQLSVSQNFASTAVTVSAVLTPWKLRSVVEQVGDVGKISTW